MSDSLANRLIGVWRLVGFETRGPGDAVRLPFGPDISGLLIYTADGHMSGQVMRAGRPGFSAPTMPGGSDAEVRAAATGYIAYAGTYDVDETERVVIHHVAVSLFPNLVGTDQRRFVTLAGGRLDLATPSERSRVSVLRWERVPR